MLNPRKTLVRALSGIVYITLVVGLLLVADWGLPLLALVFAFMAASEFLTITGGETEFKFSRFLDVITVMCLVMIPLDLVFVGAWIILLLLRLSMSLYSTKPESVKRLALVMAVQVYIGAPLAFMVMLGTWIASPMAVLAVFFFLWINDTGAYTVGSLCGRHKLFERISPNKTWEGFIGGLFFTLAAAALFGIFASDWFRLPSTLGLWLGMGALVTVAGTYGDLFESRLKRLLQIKDSGSIMPGHGGVLDRIDSLLFAMPAVCVYLAIFLYFDIYLSI